MSDSTISKQHVVKERYAAIAKGSADKNLESQSNLSSSELRKLAESIGYSSENISHMEGANLGLGCGNPLALQQIKRGDVVLDLGSGAGFDALLAADQVGVSGFVIGVDMTYDMVKKARENAAQRKTKNVVFREGYIEDLPVGDNSVNVVISNCVINLSQDKQKVFNEAYRVLKSGGSFAVSDIALNYELPDTIKDNAAMYAGCISGSILKSDYIEMIKKAGFRDVHIESEINAVSLIPQDLLEKMTDMFEISGDEMKNLPDNSVVSIYVKAVKN